MNGNTLKHTRDIARKLLESGFSLVELMVAMALGLVILAAVVQVFITSNATYRLDEGLARVQEGARFSIDFLAKDIRMAGYLGCNSRLTGAPELGNIAKPSNQATTFNPGGIRGYRYACAAACTGGLAEWDPALPGDYFAAGDVQMGSDVIIINRGSDLGTNLTGNTTPDNANIQIVDTATVAGQISDGDILMVSDCVAADIFKVTNITPPGGSGKYTIVHSASTNTNPKLTHSYGNDARLMKLVSRAYYVGASATPNETSLFRKELGTGGALNTPEELVEGVEAMKILYGIDKAAAGAPAQGTPARYVVPVDVADWNKVVSVRLGIVVRTPGVVDTELDTTPHYDVLDDTLTSLDDFDPVDDNRRRRVFNTTVRVRNH